MSSRRHKSARSTRKRAAHAEEHENHERWLISYADMITLLMALFIVLFAMSQVDQTKFDALRRSLAGSFAFGSNPVQVGPPQVIPGSNGVMEGRAAGSGSDGAARTAVPDLAPKLAGAGVQVQDKEVQQAVQAAERSDARNRAKAAEAEAKNLREVQHAIERALARRGQAGSASFRIDRRGLVVTIVTSDVVFASGRAELLGDGRRIIDAVGSAVRPLKNRIEVDGHTNQVAARPVDYPSEWELSSARASSVVRRLIDVSKLSSSRLSAVGYAGERPLYAPSDPRSVTLNRRVEVVVMTTLPPETQGLLTGAAGPGNG